MVDDYPGPGAPPDCATDEVLGDSAIRSGDRPIAAVLLFGDEIIGSGFNTVCRNGNAGGHAEINAISSALRRLGAERFMGLDRDSLALITTYEPCPMCRGAIVYYVIRNVAILKAKPPAELVQEDIRILRYYLMRRISGPESLQDSLFYLQEGRSSSIGGRLMQKTGG